MTVVCLLLPKDSDVRDIIVLLESEDVLLLHLPPAVSVAPPHVPLRRVQVEHDPPALPRHPAEVQRRLEPVVLELEPVALPGLDHVLPQVEVPRLAVDGERRALRQQVEDLDLCVRVRVVFITAGLCRSDRRLTGR